MKFFLHSITAAGFFIRAAPLEKISKNFKLILAIEATVQFGIGFPKLYFFLDFIPLCIGRQRSIVVIKEVLAVRLLGMRVIGNRIRWNEKCVERRRNSSSEIWTIYCDSDPSKISYFSIQGINWNFKINSTSSLSS